MNPNSVLYVIAGIIVVAGLFLIVFPSTAKKWFEHDPKFQIRQTPQSLEIKSEGALRALGIGLLVVAAIVAYYGYVVRWPT